jgi:hypothetical protein
MNEYPIINISEWEEDKGTIGKGSKVKKILIHPETRLTVMFKLPAEGSGDVWSEKIATEIGKAIGFDVQEVDFAFDGENIGSLSYWFLEAGERLLEGAELIKEEGFEFNERSTKGYDFQMIEKVLYNHNPLFIDKFIDILVFDTLIGNTDRHSQNWGMIINQKGEKKLAPAYDNSSSLGREFNSNISKVQIRLSDQNAFESYCHCRSKCFIGFNGCYKIPHLEYIEYLYKEKPEFINKNLTKLKLLTQSMIEEIVEKVPVKIMNQYCKEFVIKFLVYRRNFLLKLLKEGDQYGS